MEPRSGDNCLAIDFTVALITTSCEAAHVANRRVRLYEPRGNRASGAREASDIAAPRLPTIFSSRKPKARKASPWASLQPLQPQLRSWLACLAQLFGALFYMFALR